MRPAHEVASLDKSGPEESRPTSSTTRSLSNFFCRMNAALLKIPSIRGGTPFCRAVHIGSVAHPNRLPAPPLFCFPTEFSATQAAAPYKWAGGTHLPTSKGAHSFLPNHPPQTQES